MEVYKNAEKIQTNEAEKTKKRNEMERFIEFANKFMSAHGIHAENKQTIFMDHYNKLFPDDFKQHIIPEIGEEKFHATLSEYKKWPKWLSGGFFGIFAPKK